MQSLALVLSYVPPPLQTGTYVWHAVVTPVAPDGRTPDSNQAYELRSTFPVEHRLTLSGRRAKGGFAILSGQLTAAGAPEPHRVVTITRLVRKIVRGGRVVFLDSIAGERKTDAHGAYSLRVPLRSTSGFVASTEEIYERCSGPTVAPAGRVSASEPGTASVPITLSVANPGR